MRFYVSSRGLRNAFLTAAVALPALSQPRVSAVVNAASNRLTQSPISGIAQGALAVAYGQGLGPSQLVAVDAFPLPIRLGGTSVAITSGGVTVDALMVYSLDTQIAFIVPSRTSIAAAEVRVTYDQQTSAPAAVNVVANSVGIYTWRQNGTGQAVATDGLTARVITLESPAKPQQVLNVWSDGLGAIAGDDAVAPPAGKVADVEAWVGAQKADVLYSGRSPCCSGLDQIVVRLPDNVPSGCAVPFYFKGTGFVSNVATLPVTANGAPCAEPLDLNGLSIAGKSSVATGSLLLERMFNRGSSGSIDTFDFAHFTFLKYSQAFYNNFQSSEPPAGTCLTFQPANTDLANPALMNAGPQVTLTLQGNTFPFPRDDFGGYGVFIQGRSPLDFSGPGTLNNGQGAEVPAFNMTLETPPLPAFQWPQQTTQSEVSLSQPLTVNWSGSEPDGFVTVSLSGGDNLSLAVVCRASGAQNQLTVPVDLLRLLSPGAGNLSVFELRPNAVSNRPAALDAFRYARRVVRSRGVSLRP